MPSNQPVVLLREIGTPRYLPIWIGTVEATAIAFAQEGVTPPRPMTHDLIKDLLDALGEELTEVRITHLEDGVFYAALCSPPGTRCPPGPAMPSPSRCAPGRPSWATRTCSMRPGSRSRTPPSRRRRTDAADGENDPEQEVEKFREFLDHVTPEDFDKPS